jgi:hypothetical protein
MATRTLSLLYLYLHSTLCCMVIHIYIVQPYEHWTLDHHYKQAPSGRLAKAELGVAQRHCVSGDTCGKRHWCRRCRPLRDLRARAPLAAWDIDILSSKRWLY